MPPSNPPLNLRVLNTPAETPKKRAGRPPALEMPPLPTEIIDGMSTVEAAHFEYFVRAYEQAFVQKYQKPPTPTARLNIVQAGLDYIHLLRLQAEQMKSGILVSQARQHPGVQVRAWLASAGLQERDLEVGKKPDADDKAATRAALLGLSS